MVVSMSTKVLVEGSGGSDVGVSDMYTLHVYAA